MSNSDKQATLRGRSIPKSLICAAFVGCLHMLVPALVLSISAGPAEATTCPDISVDNEKINADTRNSLAELERRFASYSNETDLLDERNSILLEFPFTDQKIFIDIFYARYCNMVENSNITLPEKQFQLEEARNELYQKVPFAEIVADTRTIDQSSIPPYLKMIQYASMAAESPNPDMPIQFNRPSHPATSPGMFADSHNRQGDQTDFLREPPFVVTRANKHFVMVASAPSYETAVSEMKRLKRKAPQYDFVVYAPYRSNPNYAIMMATWIPYSLAKRVLELAKRDVNPGSIIWSCRSEGNDC